jgi:hypothetical protein
MLAFSLGAMFCIPGLLWLGMLSRWRQDEEPAEQPAKTASGEEEVLESRVG